MRTWNLVPIGLTTGLVALTAVAGVGIGVSAAADDPKPVPTPTVTVTATVTATPKARPRVHRKARPTVTPKPAKRATPRATRSTSRPLDVRPVAAKALAKAMLTQRGWGGQWRQFNALEMGEAGWNSHAVNPSSGACGLPQALPCSKLPNGVGTPIGGQLTWMLDYIARNYGSPAKAYAAWLSRSPHWY